MSSLPSTAKDTGWIHCLPRKPRIMPFASVDPTVASVIAIALAVMAAIAIWIIKDESHKGPRDDIDWDI